MTFDSLMHVSYMTDHMDEMFRFYHETLGLRPKMVMRYRDYADRPKSIFYAPAREKPDAICSVYFEIVPGQFVELLECLPGITLPREHLRCPHFALTVKDIRKAKEELVQKNVPIDSDIGIGPTGTYQMWIHDPDGNPFEIMQYTERSLQIIGNCEE